MDAQLVLLQMMLAQDAKLDGGQMPLLNSAKFALLLVAQLALMQQLVQELHQDMFQYQELQ